jgi:hypothetical protein
VLGTNLIYPQQRFHHDDPAGKFKSGVGVGLGPLFFDGPDLFANLIRPRDTVQRLVQQRSRHLHDFRLSIGGTLVFGTRGRKRTFNVESEV